MWMRLIVVSLVGLTHFVPLPSNALLTGGGHFTHFCTTWFKVLVRTVRSCLPETGMENES